MADTVNEHAKILPYAPVPLPRKRRIVWLVVISIICIAMTAVGITKYNAIQAQQRRDEYRAQWLKVYDIASERKRNDRRIGDRITISGIAADHKFGPTVQSNDGWDYVVDIEGHAWPDEVLGQTVIVTGVLEYRDGGFLSTNEPGKRMPYSGLKSATWSVKPAP